MFRRNWHIIAFAFAAAFVLVGTFTTAGTVRYSRHGAQLPERVLVQAWTDDDATLVKRMRDYVRSLSK